MYPITSVVQKFDYILQEKIKDLGSQNSWLKTKPYVTALNQIVGKVKHCLPSDDSNH